MTWFDAVAFILLALVAWLESVRGFGRALFDLIGAIIALKLAPAVAAPLADSLTVMSSESANQAFWMAATFVFLAALVLLVTRLIYHSTLLSLDYLDPAVGALFGVFIGLVVVFFFLHTMQVGYKGTDQAKLLMNSFAGREVLELRSYHTVVTALRDLGK